MLLRYVLVGLFGCNSADLLMLLPGPAVPLPDVWGWPVSLGLEEFPLVGRLLLLAGLGSVSLTPVDRSLCSSYATLPTPSG